MLKHTFENFHQKAEMYLSSFWCLCIQMISSVYVISNSKHTIAYQNNMHQFPFILEHLQGLDHKHIKIGEQTEKQTNENQTFFTFV